MNDVCLKQLIDKTGNYDFKQAESKGNGNFDQKTTLIESIRHVFDDESCMIANTFCR